jgi:hypothetical protein
MLGGQAHQKIVPTNWLQLVDPELTVSIRCTVHEILYPLMSSGDFLLAN